MTQRVVIIAGLAIGMIVATMPVRAESPEDAQIDFANGLFRRGYFDMAAEQYRIYLDDFPNGPHVAAALYRLGEAEYSSERYEAGLQAFEEYLTRFPDSDDRNRVRLRKGEILFRLEQYDEARNMLQSLTDASDATIRAGALYYLARLYADTNQHDRARDVFRRLVENEDESPLAPYARYHLAFSLVALEDLENAAIEFSTVATSEVDDRLRMESRFRAAETYDKIGWFDAAVAAYRQLREEYPGTMFAERAIYGHAWALYHAGHYQEAADAAQAFAEAHPDSPRSVGVRYLQANCLQQQGALDQALTLYRELKTAHADTEFGLRSQYKTAWTLHQLGRVDEAEEEVSAFLAAHSASPFVGDAAFLRGIILEEKGDMEEAFKEFRLVAERYPDSEFAAEALFKSGECLSALGRMDEAGEAFENFARRYPDNPLAEEAVLRVGDAEFFADAFGDAVERYKGILESAPNPSVELETLYRLAITYHNMQDYPSSVETFRTLREKYPDSRHVAEAHLRIGDHLLRDEDKAVESIAEYQAAYDAAPAGRHAGAALRGVALARYENNDYDGAATTFLDVIAEFPNTRLNEKTYAWLGERLFEHERWEDAATVFSAMLAALPNHPNPERIQFRIAESFENAGDAEQAARLYQAVVDDAPQSAAAVESRFRMAKLYEEQGELDRAFELYEGAANANTGDTAARARFRLGELYEQKEDYDAAARSFMRVAILFLHEELSPEALWRAGQAFEKAGQSGQAERAYQELVETFPESPLVAEAETALASTGGDSS